MELIGDAQNNTDASIIYSQKKLFTLKKKTAALR
jgi:hypothetical protein